MQGIPLKPVYTSEDLQQLQQQGVTDEVRVGRVHTSLKPQLLPCAEQRTEEVVFTGLSVFLEFPGWCPPYQWCH
jgi:hypothetical protein